MNGDDKEIIYIETTIKIVIRGWSIEAANIKLLH
jgi:hypothetical protein